MVPEITVTALKWGEKYKAAYYNTLFRMVERHLSVPFDFLLYTDDPRGIFPSILCRPIEEGLRSWWGKMNLYRPAPVGVLTDKILFLDVDIVITGSLDDLVRYPSDACYMRDYPEDYPGLSDEQRAAANTSVILLRKGSRSAVWDFYVSKGMPNGAEGGGYSDQNVLNESGTQRDLFPDSWVRSYKLHKMDRGLTPDCRIVVFHGDPKPWDLDDEWIAEHWR